MSFSTSSRAADEVSGPIVVKNSSARGLSAAETETENPKCYIVDLLDEQHNKAEEEARIIRRWIYIISCIPVASLAATCLVTGGSAYLSRPW